MFLFRIIIRTRMQYYIISPFWLSWHLRRGCYQLEFYLFIHDRHSLFVYSFLRFWPIITTYFRHDDWQPPTVFIGFAYRLSSFRLDPLSTVVILQPNTRALYYIRRSAKAYQAIPKFIYVQHSIRTVCTYSDDQFKSNHRTKLPGSRVSFWETSRFTTRHIYHRIVLFKGW